MPLFKRSPFPLVESPKSLEPHELVFQVRFTKEIFRDYQEYLNRINLYRQRVWTCKITGKTNLTYEEALVSEQHATEKVQQFPKELIATALHIIQFSTLKLIDLVNTISRKLQELLLVGVELYGRKEQSVCLCRVLRVLEDADKIRYEVGWIDEDKKVTGTSVINGDDLIRKKLPFSRDVLKSFIRESTTQSAPWVVHEKLASKHGISSELPEQLQHKISIQGGNYSIKKDAKQGEIGKKKRKKLGSESLIMLKKAKKENEKPREEPIKYPIDDLLVQPCANDPVFTDRPSPSRDFGVPMDCVGDLLMVWDFFSSFSKLLHLWPFSLEDFENAICHKGSNLILIVESHSAILHLLNKDEGEYCTAKKNKKRKSKISLVNWKDYLCDFLEMEDIPELSTYVATIKRGHYGLLDIQAKLGIFRELVTRALATNAIREQLDKYIEQRQALAATKREEALKEGRRRREEKELLKAKSDTKEQIKGDILENGGSKLHISENGCSKQQNGLVPNGKEKEVLIYKRRKISGNRESMNINMPSRKASIEQMSVKPTAENKKDPSGNEEQKKAMGRREDKEKEAREKKNHEQRKDHLEREIEKLFICTNPLGKDKNYNRYWFFRREGRIFVESSHSELWGYYSSKEEIDALMGSLNLKGERENALQRQLQKYYDRICSALQKRSSYIASKIAMEEAVVRRSTRVRAPPRYSPAFIRYVNKWKEN